MDRNNLNIKIVENGEPLVDLAKECPFLVIDLGEKRMSHEKTARVRKSVAQMLRKAYSLLPEGYTFILGDAWRPQLVQEEILHYFYERFEREHPEWSEQRIRDEIDIYAAPASGKYVSGHMTGGAIDIRLWKNGRKIPMKSSKLTYQENSLSDQPKLPAMQTRNRKIMFDALNKAGLTNYPAEFWHWSYGDAWWAKRNNKKAAVYGPIFQWEE